MKRLWFGLGLLGVILLSGLLVTHCLRKAHDPGAGQLRQAAEYVLVENWEKARELSETARNQWEKCWHLTAAVSDHDAMDDIDVRFAMLEVYEKGRDKIAYGAVCADLAECLEGLGKEHRLSWWNLF